MKEEINLDIVLQKHQDVLNAHHVGSDEFTRLLSEFGNLSYELGKKYIINN